MTREFRVVNHSFGETLRARIAASSGARAPRFGDLRGAARAVLISMALLAAVPAARAQATVQTTGPSGATPTDTASLSAAWAPQTLAERGNALMASPLVGQVRDTASDMVLTAMNFLGVRYRRGGTTAENGFDCSGFTRHIFERSLGLVLPRRAEEQAKAPGLVDVARNELKPGDLVFFNTVRRTFSHVGIYVGEGKFIHAPKPGGKVRVEDMRYAYWARRFTGARRVEDGIDSPRTAGASTAGPSKFDAVNASLLDTTGETPAALRSLWLQATGAASAATGGAVSLEALLPAKP